MQFKEAIMSLSAALNVGYSVENALRETQKDLQLLYRKDEPILQELRYMIRQLDMNLTVEAILREFALRTEEEEVQLFVDVFSMAKRNGGDMIAIIRNAVDEIGEKIDVKREFGVMSAVPAAMICYLKLSFPAFMDVLYGTLLGAGVMTLCLVIYVVSYALGKRMAEIEV